ncbi:MAG TPA: hypothetical protein VLF66_18635 [Thermoanaerobaculia bacterium]|nr:hypothetical protein [Thermoanaerobaculia bacterium]
MPRKSILALTALCLAAPVLGLACASEPEDPAERVSEIRSRYSARLNGFVVHQVPETPAEPPVEEPAEGAEAEAAEAPPEVPVSQAVTLDVLVSLEGRESLPGLTLDVTQVDAQEEGKASWKVYLDVADVHRGPGTQIAYRLEDVDYEEGDGFHVEVRHPVPAAERGEYREFQEYAEGSE